MITGTEKLKKVIKKRLAEELTFLCDFYYKLTNREYRTERSALPTIANSITQITIFAILLCLEAVFIFLLTIYPPFF